MARAINIIFRSLFSGNKFKLKEKITCVKMFFAALFLMSKFECKLKITLGNDNIKNYYKLLQLDFDAYFQIYLQKGDKILHNVENHTTNCHVQRNCISDKLGIVWKKVCKTYHKVTYNCARLTDSGLS